MMKINYTWTRYILWLIVITFSIAMICNVKAEYDCLDYALASGEPIILVGKHPYFYGSMDSEVNHFLNYEIIDNETMRFTDYNSSSSMNVSTTSWEEIRPGVYFDGFSYFKLFIYKEPQRYWRKML